MKSQISQVFRQVVVTVLVLFAGVMSANGSEGSNTMQSVDYEIVFTIHRGETVQFPDDFKLKFVGHSHKMVMPGGPSSPLMVSVEYDLDGEKTRHTHNVYPDEDGGWSWQGRYFSLEDYEYGSIMTLKVTHPGTLRTVADGSEFFISRGETVSLSDGQKLTYVRYSHGVMKFPPYLTLRHGFDGDEVKHVISLDPGEVSWEIPGHSFVVVDYSNNARIKLKVDSVD